MPLTSPSESPLLSPRDVDAFCVQFAPRAPGHPAVRQLHQLLCALPLGAPLSHRLRWLARLSRWLRDSRQLTGLEGQIPSSTPWVRHTRLDLLLQVLEGTPIAREGMARLVRSVSGETQGLTLFSRVGLPARAGFFSEFLERLARRLLPHPPNETQLSELLLRLFPTAKAAQWLTEQPPADVAQLFSWVATPAPPEPHPEVELRRDLLDALTLLSIQAAALGLSEGLRDRCPTLSFRASPFLRLRRTADTLMAKDGASDAVRELTVVLEDCRGALAQVSRHLDAFGASLSLIFHLEHVSLLLRRMERIGQVLEAPRGEARWKEGLVLLDELVRGAQTDRSTRAVLQGSVQHFALKVMERMGQAGARFLAAWRSEYHALIHSAAGAGLLASFTVTLQLLLTHRALPPFFQAALFTLNLGGSFLLFHLLGLAWATQPPPLTATLLAQHLNEGSSQQQNEWLATLLPRIARGQTALVLGNLGCVLPASLAVAQLYSHFAQKPLLSTAQAWGQVAALHPWQSGTLLYAALTGLWLWLAGWVGGWVENGVVYRRLPEALARSEGARSLMGVQGAVRASALLLKHNAGMGSCISLGLLLAFTPVVGRFFGVPLDFRHFILSSGSLAMAGHALGPSAVVQPAFLWAVAGVFLTGMLNLGVSFALAFAAARAAQATSWSQSWAWARAAFVHFRKHLGSYLLPPRDAPQPVVPSLKSEPPAEGSVEPP